VSEVRIFILNFSNLKNKKPFRLSKNGAPTNIFKENEFEKNELNIGANKLNIGKNVKMNIKINLNKSKEFHMINDEGEMPEEDDKTIP